MSRIVREESGRFVIRLDKETEADIARLEAEPTHQFVAMVKAARLDPAKDFISSNFAGIPLAHADLRGFDFSNANLVGCRLRTAIIDHTTIVRGANIDVKDRKALARKGVFVTKPNTPIIPEDVEEQAKAMILRGEVPPAEWIPSIRHLSFFGEQTLTNVEPLRGLVNLTTLLLDYTPISSAEPLKGLVNLTTLRLDYTQISSAEPLKGLVNLRTLGLGNTQISSAEPLEGLVNLTTLWLHYTQISSAAPLKGLVKLTVVSLENTYVSEFSPLRDLPRLARVDVESRKRAKALLPQLGVGWKIKRKDREEEWYELRRVVPGVVV